jgi:protein O-mannosyl-transferase
MIRRVVTAETSNRRWLLLATLLVLLLLAYLPLREVLRNGFVNFDDYRYVLENEKVRSGITLDGVLWAFSNLEAGFWHPLTWMSHMLDCELFGLNAAGHHLSSLLLHFANCFLLFLFLARTTKALFRSALVAALFAIHPLHVESIAWVSQRKDLLSTLFWNLALLGYAGYASRPSKRRFCVTLVFFCLGLMSKPMVVTLPLIFLLLDYWPLGRLQGEGLAPPKPLVWEKAPFFALSIFSSFLTYWAEGGIGALPGTGAYPFHVRIFNAVVSYATYPVMMVFPSNLSVLYLHPGSFPFWKVAAGLFFLLFVSFWTFQQYRRKPYLAVGWLWYLVTLLPVIGLIQIGSHAHADRYTYVPLTGLFVMIVWGFSVTPPLATKVKLALGLLITAVVAGLGWLTWNQVSHWKDSVTLFGRAVRSNPGNYIAHHHLGFTMVQRGRLEEAVGHFQTAAQLNPAYLDAHLHLANTLEILGRREEAISCYRKVLDLDPGLARPHRQLGRLLLQEGHREEALFHLGTGARLDPSDSEAQALFEALREEGEARTDGPGREESGTRPRRLP